MQFLRRSWFTLLAVGFVALVGGAAPPDAQPPASDAEQALRDLEIARLRFRLYERVDYPMRLRELDSQIKLAEAQLESYRRLVAEYERFHDSRALLVTREEARLQLLAVQLRLRDLQQERVLLQIHNRDERRLRQLLIEKGEQRAAALRLVP